MLNKWTTTHLLVLMAEPPIEDQPLTSFHLRCWIWQAHRQVHHTNDDAKQHNLTALDPTSAPMLITRHLTPSWSPHNKLFTRISFYPSSSFIWVKKRRESP